MTLQKVFLRNVCIYPKKFKTSISRTGYFVRTSQKRKELEILKRSFENHGNDRDVMLAYCSCLIKNNQTDYARTLLESSSQKFNEDIDFMLLMAVFIFKNE